jgi:GMP synthase-like glutamine amidotransferase
VEVDEGEPLPDWRAFDGIVAMGGPMGAYDHETLPWLGQEKPPGRTVSRSPAIAPYDRASRPRPTS